MHNKNKDYYHKGDLDTLEKFYTYGLYKELTARDQKLMKSEKLLKYRDILDYMLEHNCKIEQESVKALELMERL